MSGTGGAPSRLWRAGALVAARAVAAAASVVLLLWAYRILDNIWGYNDSGTLTYVVFAAVPGVPGLFAAWFAVQGRLGR